jgi:subtilisin family serine protease
MTLSRLNNRENSVMIPGSSESVDAGNGVTGAGAGETTGRYVVVFADEDGEAAHVAALRASGLANVASSNDFDAQALDVTQTQDADGVFFSELGVAVVTAEPSQLSSLQSSDRGGILAVEPELVFHVLSQPRGRDYMLGYRDGVTDLCERLAPSGGVDAAAAGTTSFQDTAQFTWGLQATAVSTSSRSGRGVKLAVLDTGFDLNHPDFVGRSITAQSFIPGETPQDGHGHGTHCIGTSCGPKTPVGTRRYGIAYDADIFVGKVLNNQGSGTDTNILAGINWAVANRCQVLSMSLGADVRQVSQRYERVGRRALAAGSLIIAAAGNNAHRSVGDPGFVGIPANSQSIMAVAAVDEQLAVANFSARSNPVRGGQIDVAGPGVRVYSSWLMPQRYNRISGTSMATPHASGVAALLCEATGNVAGQLWSTLTQQAQRLPLPSVDVGAGLVQAPQ